MRGEFDPLRIELLAVGLAEDSAQGGAAHLLQRLRHGGQGGDGLFRLIRAIEAHQAQILGDPQSVPPGFGQDAEADAVAPRENGRRGLGKCHERL